MRSAFTVRDKELTVPEREQAEKSNDSKSGKDAFRGIGFVHFALAEDAKRALEAVSAGVDLKGRKVIAELALRKNAKPTDAKITKREPRDKSATHPLSAAAKTVPAKRAKKVDESSSVLIKIGKGGEKLGFDKKQLFKKVRKCGELAELVYPYKENVHMAKLLFKSPKEATKATPKLDQHIFKGHSISVCSRDHVADIKYHRLIVRNLSFHTTLDEIKNAFCAHGDVLDVTLPKKPGKEDMSRGFAFVQMATREQASKAIAELNGKEVGKRTVAIDWALNKTVFEKLQSEEKSKETTPADQDATGKQSIAVVQETTKDSGNVPKGLLKDSHDKEHEPEQEVEVEAKGDDKGDYNEEDDKESGEDWSNAENPDLNTTVFIRNVSFATEEIDLIEALSAFGHVEYCKIVRDAQSGTSKGTAFAKFSSKKSASAACKASEQGLCQDQLEYQESIPTSSFASPLDKSLAELGSKLDELSRKRTGKEFKSIITANSSLLPADGDARAQGIIVDGRVLMVAPAVDRKSAAKLRKDHSFIDSGPQDRRNLYLLNETAIKTKTSISRSFWPAIDISHHDQMLKDRRRELKSNANLFLSTTRLSIRHLPATVTDAELKLVLRTAVKRARAFGQEEEGYPIVDSKVIASAAKERPILKQVKIVRAEADRKSKSKGYGFAQWTHHVHALLCVRYLTNYRPDLWKELLPDHFSARRHLEKGEVFRAKAPLVEFATEKSAIVAKRNERLIRSKSTN